MDQDYLNALLSDIDKAKTSEEKIQLLVISMSEMSKYQQRTTKLLEGIGQTLNNASLATTTLSETMGKLVDRTTNLEEAFSVTTDQMVTMSQTQTRHMENILDLHKHLIRIEENFHDVYKLIK